MNRIFLTLAVIFTCQLANGQSKNFIDQPYLETTAKVDSLVKPDIIYLDILLDEKDSKNRTSVEVLENSMAAKLSDLGIDLETQLTLSDLASNFKKHFLKQKDVLKSKAYKLKVFDAQTAGKVIVELENIGISNVSLDKTEFSKIEALKLALKSKAVRKAKLQAEYLVAPLNQKIGGALFITDKYDLDYQRTLNEVVVGGIVQRVDPKKHRNP
ncbi:SIMPL domain-containing protein [Persicobacter psychrovividus]|uniref:SIMPL domain-containing protein n=1 Tax=Persicobacter psychrovividus TaxID=387638 RepID=A0ABM7VHX1_9BACT|nr:hypothetical protein PEPS_28470 [Persicobacter psychrovividus]